jgi:hypothetical protein
VVEQFISRHQVKDTVVLYDNIYVGDGIGCLSASQREYVCSMSETGMTSNFPENGVKEISGKDEVTIMDTIRRCGTWCGYSSMPRQPSTKCRYNIKRIYGNTGSISIMAYLTLQDCPDRSGRPVRSGIQFIADASAGSAFIRRRRRVGACPCHPGTGYFNGRSFRQQEIDPFRRKSGRWRCGVRENRAGKISNLR